MSEGVDGILRLAARLTAADLHMSPVSTAGSVTARAA